MKITGMSMSVEEQVGSGGQGGAQAPNNFKNNGATSRALIRCIVLYCFENSCISKLPTVTRAVGIGRARLNPSSDIQLKFATIPVKIR